MARSSTVFVSRLARVKNPTARSEAEDGAAGAAADATAAESSAAKRVSVSHLCRNRRNRHWNSFFFKVERLSTYSTAD